MKTRKTFLYVIIALTMSFGFMSCKKYPDDNILISLRTPEERISNTWKVENYKINNTDMTSLAQGYTESFTKGGGYSYSWELNSGSGTWALHNKDKEIQLTGNDTHSSNNLYILKLEETEFWYYYLDGDGDKHEFHMVEKN
jgi:hypothetical protein